jgi:hypothetical protein
MPLSARVLYRIPVVFIQELDFSLINCSGHGRVHGGSHMDILLTGDHKVYGFSKSVLATFFGLFISGRFVFFF